VFAHSPGFFKGFPRLPNPQANGLPYFIIHTAMPSVSIALMIG
jgi:hypothetical protein